MHGQLDRSAAGLIKIDATIMPLPECAWRDAASNNDQNTILLYIYRS
jgi:hypothetical protein